MPINYQALFDMSMSHDEGMRALAATAAKKLTPAEIQEFSAFQKAHPAGDERHRQDNSFLGAPPELAALGVVGAARGIPAAANAVKDSGIVQGAMNASKGIPAAVKSGGLSYLGWEGASKIGDLLGLPAPLKTMLGLAGAHFAGGIGSSAGAAEEVGVPKATPPMSDAEFAATAGRQRGEPLVERPTKPGALRVGSDQIDNGDFPSQQGGVSVDPPNLDRVPKANRVDGGAIGRSQSGGVKVDVVPPSMPADVSRRKTRQEIDAIAGGQASPYLGKPPQGFKGTKFNEADGGADSLGQLLDATHGADHATMPNGGPGNKPPLTKPDVTRKSGTGSSHGPTDEYYNGKKYDIGTSGDAQTAAKRSKGRAMRDWAEKKTNQTDESMGHSEASKADNGRTRDAYNTDEAQMKKIRELLASMGI